MKISLAACALLLAAASAHAQISLTSAADMALRNNVKVKLAEDDVRKARAGLEEARDVYIPTINGSSAGLGYSYGFPLGTPTVYTFSSTSIVYSASQNDYVRSSRDALVASNLALKAVREGVLEEVTTTYLNVSHDQRKRAALAQELSYAQHLEAIVKDRLDAGQDTNMEYTSARRTRVRIQLLALTVDDDLEVQRDHLSRLIGMAGTRVDTVPDGVPELTLSAAATRAAAATTSYDSPGVQSAFANAQSKFEQAFGDQKYAFRPLISFGAEYSKFSTYNNSYVRYYPSVQGYNDPATGKFVPLTSEAVGFSINISVPIFDRSHTARAEASMADALHARHEAEQSRTTEAEGRLKLNNGLRELALRTELAGLDRDYAQEQLNVILIQMQAPPTNGGPVTTPKEEQNARINERQLFIDMLDQQHLLDETEVNLLRQTGTLEGWLKSSLTQTSAVLR